MKKIREDIKKRVGAFFLMLTFLFIGGITLVSTHQSYKACTEKINAVVSDSYVEDGDDVTYYCVFSYSYDNRDYSRDYVVPHNFKRKVGKNFKIRINPDNPTEIYTKYDLLGYVFSGLLIVMGGILGVLLLKREI